MTNYRIVTEVNSPTDDYGSDFSTRTEVLWKGQHNPYSTEELSNITPPETSTEHGPVFLQQQRVMHLGWRTIHASAQEI